MAALMAPDDAAPDAALDAAPLEPPPPIMEEKLNPPLPPPEPYPPPPDEGARCVAAVPTKYEAAASPIPPMNWPNA